MCIFFFLLCIVQKYLLRKMLFKPKQFTPASGVINFNDVQIAKIV